MRNEIKTIIGSLNNDPEYQINAISALHKLKKEHGDDFLEHVTNTLDKTLTSENFKELNNSTLELTRTYILESFINVIELDNKLNNQLNKL